MENPGTILLGLEALRGALGPLSGGIIDLDLLSRLERRRAENPERRAFAAIAFGPAVPGQASTEVFMLDVGPAGSGARQLPAVLTLGRHDCCDVGLIAGAALRHALLLAHPAVGDQPARLEALDLSSGVGLGVGQGRGVPQLLARQRMRFGVGDYGFLAFLAEPHQPLFPEGVEAAFEELNRGAHGVGVRLRLRPGEREEASETRALRHVHALDDEQWGGGSQVQYGTRVHAIERDAYVLEASVAELDEGVLLGRYPRCRGSLELGRHGDISRVHALLLRRGERLYLIDCGSTNGTRLEHAGAPRVKLAAEQRVWLIESGDDVLMGDMRLRLRVV
ncbi:MAG: FHA domain-containing protein [Deltaproteobacteria bacterium]|nr:FHA domain-containing protein [Deltaproteobacteria bacterium]